MINPKDFIKVELSQIENTGSCYFNWTIPEDLPYFAGHFPNNPVLPAVAIIDFSIEIIKELSKNPFLEIKTISAGKFYEPIKPNRKVQIQIENKNPSEWMLTWLDGCQLDKKLAKIQLKFS